MIPSSTCCITCHASLNIDYDISSAANSNIDCTNDSIANRLVTPALLSISTDSSFISQYQFQRPINSVEHIPSAADSLGVVPCSRVVVQCGSFPAATPDVHPPPCSYATCDLNFIHNGENVFVTKLAPRGIYDLVANAASLLHVFGPRKVPQHDPFTKSTDQFQPIILPTTFSHHFQPVLTSIPAHQHQ